MADLTEKEAGGTTKIIGANPSTGQETNFADVTSEGELKISSFANVDFQDVVKTVSTFEIKASVGASNLSNRKTLLIVNKGAQDVFYGTTGVSSTTGAVIEKDETINIDVGDNIDIFLVTAASTSDVVIQEFS